MLCHYDKKARWNQTRKDGKVKEGLVVIWTGASWNGADRVYISFLLLNYKRHSEETDAITDTKNYSALSAVSS